MLIALHNAQKILLYHPPSQPRLIQSDVNYLDEEKRILKLEAVGNGRPDYFFSTNMNWSATPWTC